MGSNSGSGGGGSGLFVYDERRDSYDLNTRILATVVICLGSVVVLMIFLHLYVRYVLLRRHRAGSFRRTLRFYVSNPHDDPAATVGLDASAIAALPTQPYRTSAKKDSGEECGGGAAAECAICLSAVEEAEIVRLLPDCNHLFHIGCVDVWLGSHSTCPVCRAAVVPPPAFVALDVGDSWAEEASDAVATSQEAASSGFLSKDLDSASARLGSSFRRMLSWERATGRRAQGGVEGLERVKSKIFTMQINVE